MAETPDPSVSTELEAIVTVRPWRDAVVERLGFPVTSPYVEGVWLPVLGPSATWALRRLGLWVEANPQGLTVDLRGLAAELGLRPNLRRSSPMVRTLGRMERFAMITWANDEILTRTTVGPVPQRHLRRLPDRVIDLHLQLVREHTAVSRNITRNPTARSTPTDPGRRDGTMSDPTPAADATARTVNNAEPPAADGRDSWTTPIDLARRRLRAVRPGPDLSR
jgi:hypothetical protein